MTSRTPEGKHTKRFIVEVKSASAGKWFRSGNTGLDKFFETREAAQAALASGLGSQDVQYRVRQK